ncbi:MAG: glycosyltransferase family 4 protein [Candidatus Bathyarchaeia archaeon]
MTDLEGCIRPALYLAEALTEEGCKVSIVSPLMSNDVEKYLGSRGIKPINLHAKLFAKNFGLSILWFETWAREAFLKLNSKHLKHDFYVTINFSHTIDAPSVFWYLQGPTAAALRDMERELTAAYKSAYKLLKQVIMQIDQKLVKNMSRDSAFLVANSKFCASLYREIGIRVDEVIYPPIDCTVFRPTTSNPSGDYVLTYFGKETRFSVIKSIADLGVKIKAFGSKAPFIPKSLINHPNVDFLGRISADQLVDAYSNALFTLFPFTHEPFGYIPVESMACGTPTLTYNMQGPSESIVDGYTGWLAKDDEEIVYKALKLWKHGYLCRVRLNCVREALKFDRNLYVQKWLEILQELLSHGRSTEQIIDVFA